MKHSRLAARAALGLLMAAAACSPGEAQPRAAATLEARSWVIGGATRTGIVATPSKSSPSGPPLVLVFHGHGGTAVNMSRALPIHAKWPEAVVIYLQGLPSPRVIADSRGRGAGWQTAPGAQGDRDVRFADSVIAWARATHKVDPKRVFAAGHSNGGWFTYVLWVTRPETFAAFAPASAVFGKMITGAKPKPALIIAGEKDRLVSYGLQRRTIAAVIDLNQAATVGEDWYGGARLHDSPIADVVTYVYPGAHPLPGNASDVVARFFRRF